MPEITTMNLVLTAPRLYMPIGFVPRFEVNFFIDEDSVVAHLELAGIGE